MKSLKMIKVRNVDTPERTGRNAGFDFFVPNGHYAGRIISANERATIPSGIKVRIPEGHALIAFNKSGVASKKGLQVGACVVDENYTGEICLDVYNTGVKPVVIAPGMKLIQFILIPVLYANVEVLDSEEELYKNFDTNERGGKGFGSTGEYKTKKIH